MDINKLALEKHQEWAGKIEIVSRVKVDSREALSLAYTPGVAAPCLAIKDNIDLSYTLTRRKNLVAVITDGSAVLGLGDIGPEAGMPVMEGKCVLFKEFADVDAFPLCIRSKDIDEIVRTVSLISGSFGGINLEDIGAPRCFEIERRLKEVCDIPIFHDDQHGTAVVASAAIINSLKVVGKKMNEITCVINGAGAAGVAIAKLLVQLGLKDIILIGKHGIVVEGREKMSDAQAELSKVTNKNKLHGGLAEAIAGADVFVGVSVPGILSKEMIQTMAKDPIIFAMANPTPEIMPEDALLAGARIVGTGRSDYNNQINNVLAFPGIFRGALDVRASEINDSMKKAAAFAIANLINEDELSETYVIPEAFDLRVGPAVAKAVSKAAIDSGVARI